MTATWQNGGSGWRLLAPTGFPDEQTLHDLVQETPQILLLAGAPRLVVVGKEVALGNGYADLVAVEPSGRLVVVEIKLSKNAEARRAVVAQVLTYAAHEPHLGPFAGLLETDGGGYVVLKERNMTSVPGVFAAGEVDDGRYRQTATAVGDGCRAAMDAWKWL